MIIPCYVPVCNSVFNTTAEFLHHVEEVHKLPSDNHFKCPSLDCIQVFTKLSSFKKHVHKHDFRNHDSVEQMVQEPELQIDVPTKSIRREDESIIEDDVVLSNNLKWMQQSAVQFTLNMHQRNNFTRQDVRYIQKAAEEFCAQSVEKIETVEIDCLSTQTKYELDKYLTQLKTAFRFIDTDYKFFAHLTDLKLFKSPTIFNLEQNEAKVSNNENGRTSCLVLNPIEFQVQSFFETTNILEQTLHHTAYLERADKITHFVNGTVWKQIKARYVQDDDNFILPIWIYADEFEVNDPLSSHNSIDSVCGIYYSFPTLPDAFRSKLCNILVAGFIRKVTITQTGVNKLVEKVLEPFKKLENEGIIFNLNSHLIKVRFVLCLFQGDNLGVHTLLQMSSGFNANYYCRFCRRHRTDLQKDTRECEECLRNTVNYEQDVNVGKHSETGIAGYSAFNQLASFHVVDNPSVDAMHDLYSNGVCKYGLLSALHYFVYEKRFLSRANLNTRLNYISRTSADVSLNRMPDFEEVQNKKTRGKTITGRMTASEMKAFCRNFTFIVGPYIPCDDPVWTFCKVLIRTVDFILKRTFTENDLTDLKNLIQSHHYLYQMLFSDTLKPKQHFLVHYPDTIRKSGPIERMMCFRSESKHQVFKEYAHAIKSRVNIAYTLCVKSCLQFSHDLYHKSFFDKKVEGEFSINTLQSRPYCSKIANECPFNVEEIVHFAHSIPFKGSQFKIGQFISVPENESFKLLEAEEFVKHGETIYVICRNWEKGAYDDHLLAYEAVERFDTMCIIDLNAVSGPPFSIHEVQDHYYFRINNDFN